MIQSRKVRGCLRYVREHTGTVGLKPRSGYSAEELYFVANDVFPTRIFETRIRDGLIAIDPVGTGRFEFRQDPAAVTIFGRLGRSLRACGIDL